MNFTKAAEQLCITQPAVSQHIRHLEQQYEVRLFEQTGRQIQLTPAGEVLRDTMTVMKNDEDKIALRIRSFKDSIRPMSIGATMTISEYVMPHAAAVYIRHHPEINLHIHRGNTVELTRDFDFIWARGSIFSEEIRDRCQKIKEGSRE
jgi:DNA-binding transcriptional LysR family regulator